MSSVTAALQKLAQAMDLVARLASVFFVIVVLCVMNAQVFFRYVLNSSLQWSEELSIWAMIWMVFIGSVVVIRNWEHIFIPTIPRMFPVKVTAALVVFSRLATIIFLVVITYYGWQVFNAPSNAFSHNIGVSTAWAKLSVPVGAILMVLMVLAQIADDFADILAGDWSRFRDYGALEPHDF